MKWAYGVYQVSMKFRTALIWTVIGRIHDLEVALPYGKHKVSRQNWHASLKWSIFDTFSIFSIKKPNHNCWQRVFLKISKTSQLTWLAHLIVTYCRWNFHDLMRKKGFNVKRKKLTSQHNKYDLLELLKKIAATKTTARFNCRFNEILINLMRRLYVASTEE